MANRYLIGTGNRNWNDPNNWSLTSGGSPYQPTGTEKITNAADREFSSDTGFWTKTAGAIISGGVVTFNGVSNSITKTTLVTIGKWIKITFDLNIISGNTYLQGYYSQTISTTSGSKLFYIKANTGTIAFSVESATNTTIDNISVQEVDTIAPDETTPCIFDNNSGTGTITVNATANMLDFTCTNIGALTLANAAYSFNVFGSLTLHTNLGVTFTSTAYLYMKATNAQTITCNGKVANWNRLYFDGVNGSWTNQDDMNISATVVNHTNGTWNHNNYIVTCTGSYNTVAGTKTLTLGNTTFNIGTWNNAVPTGFTFNYNTSTVNITTASTFTSANTFYNLTFTGTAAITALNSLTANITVSNNLTFTGSNASNYRLLIASNTIGTARTITCNGTVTASNVDFRDITLAGSCNKDLSAITGGSGDCGGNSGITFTPAQAQYFKKYASTANYGDAANWFSDLALTVAGRVPLPQDLGSKFLATSFNQTCTVSCNVPRIPCLDMSEVVNSITWDLANAVEAYGSYVLGNNITQSGNNINYLYGRGNFVLNLYANSLYYLNINAIGGVYTNLSNFQLPTNNFQLFAGTFDFNDYNATCSRFLFDGGTVYFGNGILTTTFILADQAFRFTSTIYAENSTLKLNPSSGANNITFSGNGKTFNKIQFSGSHTGNFDITGSNTIAELIIESGRKVRFTAGTTQTIGKITYGSGITQDCVTAGTYNLALTEIATAENANIKGCVVTQDSKLFAEANSVDSGSNNRVVFGDYFTVQEIIL